MPGPEIQINPLDEVDLALGRTCQIPLCTPPKPARYEVWIDKREKVDLCEEHVQGVETVLSALQTWIASSAEHAQNNTDDKGNPIPDSTSLWQTSARLVFCEVCRIEPAIGIACVPGIPLSVAYGRECINRHAGPYWALRANVEVCGGPSAVHPEYLDSVTFVDGEYITLREAFEKEPYVD